LITTIIFFIASIDFLGGRPSRKLELTWQLMTVKENYNFLGGEQTTFLGGCNIFLALFGKLSMVLISLAASLQGNHP
jgi:hypothetical protein